MNNIAQVKQEIDYKHKLSELRRESGLRHARGWVTTFVEYVLTALPIVAPIPNLVNLQVALTPVMGWWGAFIAAIAFELLLFGSAEIILYLQDKQMRDGGYKKPIGIAVTCSALLFVILISLIAAYEVPVHGWAVLTLPFVSVISLAFLSLKRWADIRDSIAADAEEYQTEMDRLQAEIAEISSQLSAEIRRRMDVEAEAKALRKEISKPEISTPQKRKPEISSKKISMNDRRNSIAEILKEQYRGKTFDEVTAPEIKKQLAEIFDKTDKTIGTDIQAVWEKQNWNGSVGA